MPFVKKDTSTSEPAKPAESVVPPEEETMELELSLFTNYMMGGVVYVKGKIYKFKKADALYLLSERDMNRPIWRIPQKVRPKIVSSGPVDSTQAVIPAPIEPIHGVEVAPKRINVGNDAEISGILGKDDENVTL